MEEYLKSIHPKIQEYFAILSPEGIPEFLVEYIKTPQMQKQKTSAQPVEPFILKCLAADFGILAWNIA